MNDETAPAATHDTPTPIEPRRGFSPRPILIGTGAALSVLALGIGGFAFADTLQSGGDDRIIVTSTPSGSPVGDDFAVSDADYAAVSAAALAAVGGGTVTEVERGDNAGDAAWKVEIALDNGDEAEVRLDANLNVIRVDLDSNVGEDDGTDDSGDDSGDDNGTDEGSDDNGTDDSADDNGADDSGSDDESDDSGSDDSGHGSDDSGSDDSGSGSDDD